MNANTILNTTTTGPGTPIQTMRWAMSFQAILEGTGALTAEVRIEVSLDNEHWNTWITFNMSGNDDLSEAVSLGGQWLWIRANVVSITGTDANAKVLLMVDHKPR